jgi:hypothetical protein
MFSKKPFIIRKRPKPRPTNKRILIGEYIIDLHHGQGCVYYVLSKKGSNDILSIGQHEPSTSEAEARARWTLIELEATTSSAQSTRNSFPAVG